MPLPEGMAYDGGLYKQMPALVRDIKLNVSVVRRRPCCSRFKFACSSPGAHVVIARVQMERGFKAPRDASLNSLRYWMPIMWHHIGAHAACILLGCDASQTAEQRSKSYGGARAVWVA